MIPVVLMSSNQTAIRMSHAHKGVWLIYISNMGCNRGALWQAQVAVSAGCYLAHGLEYMLSSVVMLLCCHVANGVCLTCTQDKI